MKLSKNSAGKVTFKVQNKKIVKIDKKGRITAIKKGKTVVTAKTYNKKKANNTRDNKPAIQKSNNRNQFHAFEQRNTSAAEIDQLEKMLLKR